MKIGLVGLPKSGKTSLFNLLTVAAVATSAYGGSRAEMHSGVARVPDERVDRLSGLFKPKKTTFASFEVVGYDELIAAGGSMAAVREKGQFRLEGKDYLVQDGEICHFRFNVAK